MGATTRSSSFNILVESGTPPYQRTIALWGGGRGWSSRAFLCRSRSGWGAERERLAGSVRRAPARVRTRGRSAGRESRRRGFGLSGVRATARSEVLVGVPQYSVALAARLREIPRKGEHRARAAMLDLAGRARSDERPGPGRVPAVLLPDEAALRHAGARVRCRRGVRARDRRMAARALAGLAVV